MVMLPDATHDPPFMLIRGVPSPETETGVAVLMPEMVTLAGAGVVRVETGAPVTSLKLKASGVVSGDRGSQNGCSKLALPESTPLVQVRAWEIEAQ
ncbi:MAG: hypothetical protein R3E51_00005, partial [Rhizobiaceae bacterium]